MAFEWVAGLFQSEEARGLSGESASSVALDDANPYYNYRLRRHSTDGDLVADPGLLWYTSPYVTQRQGLGTHVAAEPGEGVANYTDVLLILSQEDHARSERVTGEAWSASMERTLQQEFDNFCRRENLLRPHSHRSLGFRILRDGSDEMHGLSLGLQRGEFITGLLPNLYTGPVYGSFPVIGVHVNLPGVWEGYREVGRLHNDQILFTLGNHWLDNFSHPALAEAALYRLQQYPDGNFVHIINPDLQDRYQVTSTVQNNASVLTLATREGRPLAYLVLAVMEPPSSNTPAPTRSETPVAGQPKISMPTPAPQPKPQTAQRSDFDDPIPSVAPPMMIDDEVHNLDATTSLGGRTIIPDAPSERIFTLQERGALLQKVHFSAFMLGYDVFMGPRGELGTKVENPAATFQVRKRSTSLVAHVPGVTVDGNPARVGEQIPLETDTEITLGDTRLEYRSLRHRSDITGWPYVAEIRRPASSTYLIWGEEYRVGRSRECRVVLPDQTSNDNIHWKPKVGDGAYIRARTGDIPKANFYTDSIMVSSEHATIDLTSGDPIVRCNASHCYVFVRRGDEILSLYPTSKSDQDHILDVQPGDEVLIGNCLFQVGFSPGGEIVAPAPAPEVQLNADSLADSVASPNFDEDEEDEEPVEAPEPELAEDEEPIETEEPAEAEGLAVPPPIPVPAVVDEAPPPPPPPPAPRDDVAEDVAEEAPDEVSEDAFPELPQEVQDEETIPAPPSIDEIPPPPPPSGEDEDEDETAMFEISERELGDEDAPPAGGLGEDGSAPEPVQPEAAADSIIGTLEEFQAEDGEVDAPSLADDQGYASQAIPTPRAPTSSESTFNSELGDPEADDDVSVDEPAQASEPDEEPSDDPAVIATQPPPPRTASEDAITNPPSVVPMPFPELEQGGFDEIDVGVPPAEPGEVTVEIEPSEQPDSLSGSADTPAAAEVVFTDDAEAQFELGRPCHVILAGWMVNGEVVIGNHTDADCVLPENRIIPSQTFERCDYVRLKIRGRKGTMDLLTTTEVLVDEADPTQEHFDSVDHTLDVIRRDEEGEEDFAIRLLVVQDKKLPDPRARLIALDYEDPLAAALVTRGLPLNQPRTLELDGLTVTLTFTGEAVQFSDYGATYRQADGSFLPFFVQSGSKRFTTAPEDGSSFELTGGDRFVIGQSVYVIREE